MQYCLIHGNTNNLNKEHQILKTRYAFKIQKEDVLHGFNNINLRFFFFILFEVFFFTFIFQSNFQQILKRNYLLIL